MAPQGGGGPRLRIPQDSRRWVDAPAPRRHRWVDARDGRVGDAWLANAYHIECSRSVNTQGRGRPSRFSTPTLAMACSMVQMLISASHSASIVSVPWHWRHLVHRRSQEAGCRGCRGAPLLGPRCTRDVSTERGGSRVLDAPASIPFRRRQRQSPSAASSSQR